MVPKSVTELLTVPPVSVIFASCPSVDPSWTQHVAVLLERSTFRTRDNWSAGLFHSKFSISALDSLPRTQKVAPIFNFLVSLLEIEKLSSFYTFQKSGFIVLLK